MRRMHLGWAFLAVAVVSLVLRFLHYGGMF